MQNVKVRVAQIESFDLSRVRTFGDLTYILSIMTDVILSLDGSPLKHHECLMLAKIVMVEIIETAVEANAYGFKNEDLNTKLAVEFSTFTKYLKSMQP